MGIEASDLLICLSYSFIENPSYSFSGLISCLVLERLILGDANGCFKGEEYRGNCAAWRLGARINRSPTT